MQAVRAAGELALSLFRVEVRQWVKGASSPVSEADIAVNDLLVARLRDARPLYGWLSEESTDDAARLTAERAWVVDPIDGTRAFLAGREDWSISAALVERGRPSLAVVFAPATDEFFMAAQGQGALRNGAPLQATRGDRLAGVRAAGPQRFIDRLGGDAHSNVTVPKIGSLALRFARVAEGRLDVGFAGGNSHDWDLAAADLLVHEAGGRLTTLTGDGILYNQPLTVHPPLIAAGQDRHAGLVDRFRCWPQVSETSR